MSDIQERVGVLEVQMEKVQEGVANFRLFQARGNRFFDRFDAKADAEEDALKKRWTRSQKIAVFAILGTILAAPVARVLSEAKKVMENVLEISHWYEKHKADFEKTGYSHSSAAADANSPQR